jgi:hypothetical protein
LKYPCLYYIHLFWVLCVFFSSLLQNSLQFNRLPPILKLFPTLSCFLPPFPLFPHHSIAKK